MKIYFFIFLILSLCSVFAEDLNTYDDNEISFNYPAEFQKVVSYENFIISSCPENYICTNLLFRDPNIDMEEGAYFYYSSTISPNLYYVLNEDLKKVYEQDSGLKIISSEVTSFKGFKALKVSGTRYIGGANFKVLSLYIFDGNRVHLLSYAARAKYYDTYYYVFDAVLDSFNIKNSHKSISNWLRTTLSPENLGGIAADISWVVLIGYTLYKSIKRKQRAWIIILVINGVAGLFMAMFFSIIIPIVYLILNRKHNNNTKRKKKEK